MPWSTKLKIAIIEKDIDSMQDLLQNLPQFKTLEEMKEAQALFKESIRLASTLKDETSAAMKQMKKNMIFLKSTQAPHKNQFDKKF